MLPDDLSPSSLRSSPRITAFTDQCSETRLIPTIQVKSEGFNVGKRSSSSAGMQLRDQDSQVTLPQPLSIEALPNETLLDIFDFYVGQARHIEAWIALVHVCKRWRDAVFTSSIRLNVRLLYTKRRSVRKMLDAWPSFPPITMSGLERAISSSKTEEIEEIVAALQNRDRIFEMVLPHLPLSSFDIFTAMMQDSFPMLTYLNFGSKIGYSPTLPDSFLGGSAPQLQILRLSAVTFPALPTLLLSTNVLVELRLWDIPHSGYISPEAMVNCLSSLNKLQEFHLGFSSPPSRPDQPSERSSSLTCIDLPTLRHFLFCGTNRYIEDLAARIDAPSLNFFSIKLLDHLLDTSQLSKFIGHLANFKRLNRADVHLYEDILHTKLTLDKSRNGETYLGVEISKLDSESKVSSFLRVIGSSMLPLYSLEHVNIWGDGDRPVAPQDNTEDAQWLRLFRLLPSVKNLNISNELILQVLRALEELPAEKAVKVLPALQNIFLKRVRLPEAVQEAIGPFVAARKLSGHPVIVHH